MSEFLVDAYSFFLLLRYSKLKDLGVDTTDVTIPREKSFDPQNIPSFLDYGRKEVEGDWNKFINSYCREDPGAQNTNVNYWMGNCRTVVNQLKISASTFAAVYPFGGPDTQYTDDKWSTLINITVF